MIYPKGEVVHQNLSTAFTDVDQLLGTLQASAFSGTVEVDFPDGKGIFFLSGGDILNTEYYGEGGKDKYSGEEAAQRVLSFSKSKDGKLNVYKFTPEQVQFISGTLKSELLYKGLSTDFILMDRLLAKLKDEKLWGFLEIFSKENQPMGTLFMKNGDLVEMFISSETGPSFFFDQKSIPAFVENVNNQGALIQVYKTQAGKSAESEAKETASMVPPIPPEQPPTSPIIEPPVAAIKFDKIDRIEDIENVSDMQEVDRIIKDEVRIIVEEGKSLQDLADEFKPDFKETEPEDSSTIPPSMTQPSPVIPASEGGGLREVISVLQEILSKTERFVDGSSGKGTFVKTFKRSLIDKSDIYHFLDPFMGQFDYNEGKIIFHGNTEIAEFARGVGECYNLTLTQLKKEYPKNMVLPVSLKAEIESSFNRYQEITKSLGIESVPPLLF